MCLFFTRSAFFHSHSLSLTLSLHASLILFLPRISFMTIVNFLLFTSSFPVQVNWGCFQLVRMTRYTLCITAVIFYVTIVIYLFSTSLKDDVANLTTIRVLRSRVKTHARAFSPPRTLFHSLSLFFQEAFTYILHLQWHN